MRKILLWLITFNCFAIEAQVTCNDYTIYANSTSAFGSLTDSTCMFLCAGTTDGVWTGSGCTDSIVLTMNGSPVNSLDLYFGKVNTDDYATVSVDGGGTMEISNPFNTGLNGNVVGPYNCGTATFGDVFFTVTSTQPFSNVYIVNTGCSSGWVLYCPDNVVPPAPKDSTIKVCDGQFDLNNYLQPHNDIGSWTEITSSGQFDSQNGTVTTTGLSYDIYTFNYSYTECNVYRETAIKIDYGVNISCVDTTDSIPPVIPPPVDEKEVTAFSPNADGVNDFLNLNMLIDSLGNEVYIYNRWGSMVYHIANYDNDQNVWTGNFPSGVPAPVGTYYYLIYYDNGEFKKGWVQLLR
ncbi:MAG: gliding motility-associated C-terminal domain-containing protein [Crocinitomicaceae bacterium]|nr:gliding motility-associated C-terminal domain-containing protein [Crocinitomicaceae bacterium]